MGKGRVAATSLFQAVQTRTSSLIPVFVTGIQPAQVLGLKGLFPSAQTRVDWIPVTSTGMREGGGARIIVRYGREPPSVSAAISSKTPAPSPAMIKPSIPQDLPLP